VPGVHEAVAAFQQLVADVTAEPPLDEGALLIAAAGTGADPEAGLTRLDELAAELHDALDRGVGLAEHLFVHQGFAGNTLRYHDPRNSFLPDVIERRLGIPISLGVLTIELGRRVGIAAHGVGMPGHFLVGLDADDARLLDPFHGGTWLDVDGCRALFARLHGPGVPFRAEYLAPTGTRPILRRMLANLRQVYVAERSASARWVVQMQLAFPESTAAERAEGADVLASVGAFGDAATVFDGLAARMSDADARDAFARRAVAYRSRAN
jgi:regulator of sirC expression with transglutaminase-like and TPR domain